MHEPGRNGRAHRVPADDPPLGARIGADDCLTDLDRVLPMRIGAARLPGQLRNMHTESIHRNGPGQRCISLRVNAAAWEKQQ